MAKMFYTMDETKAALGKSEDEIRQLAREGKLREFRDGPRLMFKADQVEALKGESASDQVGLSAGDTHSPLGLADSKSGSGTGTPIGLKDATATGGPLSKDDTASAMDVGLSGSLSGSIGGGSLAGSLGGSLGGTAAGMPSPNASRTPGKQGINVLGEEAPEVADPMAQTHITPPKDQISLEGVGSGSGLLDLTRETDDTSLGAALLDEISPGSATGRRISPTPGAAVPSSGSTAGMTSISSLELPTEPMPAPANSAAPVLVEVRDPMAPAFAAGSIAGILMLLFGGLVLINAISGDSPMVDTRFAFVKALWMDDAMKSFLVVAGVGLVLTFILFVIGMILGRSNREATVA